MAGILNTAAQRINADTAGLTHTGGEPNPGQAQAATPAEITQSFVHTASGALDALFRQEPVPAAPVATGTEVASTATVGPNGGLVPSALSHITTGFAAPSPGPGPAAGWDPLGQLLHQPGSAGQVPGQSLPDRGTSAARSLVERARGWLGL
jgi:hypothetical protein